jgi:electron transfer flavoprotein beta subunit
MKIAVCVKQIPEGNSRIDPGTKRLDRGGEGALNAFDANAVEEALRLKDSTGEGEVVLLSLGPAKAQDALRKALAMGADRAVLISDDAAAGSDLVATSYALAKALEREGADVVLFGQQAGDSDGAVLWAAVADRLRLPVVSQAAEITHADGKLTVKRQTEFGYDVIEAPLPAVVAVSDAINEPRYPSLKGIMGAKSKPQETSASKRTVQVNRARAPRCTRSTIRRRAASRRRSKTTATLPRRSSTSLRRSGSYERRSPSAPSREGNHVSLTSSLL